MNPQVQKALDDEVVRDSLTVPERAELSAAESTLDALVRAIPVEPFPDLAPAVLRRLQRASSRAQTGARRPAAHRESKSSVANWLWHPRSVAITWRPAYALAAAVVFIAAFATNSLRPRPATVVAASGHEVFTEFVLHAPDAKRVAVAGDFSSWQPAHVMTRSKAGVWTVVVPLTPGVHDYSFVVDGERWVPDPAAPAVNDGFGGVNSRLAVLSPDGGRS